MHQFTQKSTDAELLEGCRQQNRLAQKYLYQRYYGKMLGISMRYTSHPEEARDVLNRAFLKVFEKLKQYSKGSLSGWIAKIVLNTAIDYVRQHTKYRQIIDLNEERERPLNAEILEQLYAEDLFKLIQQLPDTSRAVFSLFVIDGYKHREIADLLKININTSKWHLAEAKRLLKKAVEKLTNRAFEKQVY